MRVILDAMGGDNAPLAPVMGAVQAAKAITTKPKRIVLTVFIVLVRVVQKKHRKDLRGGFLRLAKRTKPQHTVRM